MKKHVLKLIMIVFFIFSFFKFYTIHSQNSIRKNQYYRIEGLKEDKDSLNMSIADSCYFFIKYMKKNKFEIRVSAKKDSINSIYCFEWKNGKIENKHSPYCYSVGKAKHKKDLIYFNWKKGIENVNELFSISNKTIFSKFYKSMNSAMKVIEIQNEILLIPLYPSTNKGVIVLKEGDFKTTFKEY